MEFLNYFHDFMMFWVIVILLFVSYMSLVLVSNTYLDKNTTDSHLLETLWTTIPIFILISMAFPSLYLLYLIEDYSEPSITVKVVGHQWYWEYQYLSTWELSSFDSYIIKDLPSRYSLFYTLDVDNRLVLPVSTNILFLISSADVLHCWTLPSLGIKADATPGRLNYLTTLVGLEGVYYGQCSEICGSNHSFMPIVCEFLPMSDFTNFLTTLNV